MKIKKVMHIALLLVVLLSLFVSCSICLGAPQKTEPSYKKIPTEQWQNLTYSISLHEANLIMVQDMLMQQEMLSKELLQLLINANVELNTARQELKNAKTSLKKAEEALKKLSESYQLLKVQIETERKESAKREKEAYHKGLLNGFGLGALVTGIFYISNNIQK